ncbi:MAG TPA: oligopeptide/dipeptide ABC transporter ATP-binding protein, partial [Micromonosporaceae bacterium]
HSFPALRGEKHELSGIPGSPPDLRSMPSGCAFHPRCPHAFDPCKTDQPTLGAPSDRATTAADGRTTACWLHEIRPTTVGVTR